MKNKVLKHCARKKFFYRFFMRKSPRAGAMFGLAWMSMTVGLLPIVLFAILLCCGVFQHVWKVIAVSLSLLLLASPFYIYGVLLCAFGISRIYRNITGYKAVGSVAGVLGAWFLPLLGVVLIPPLICKKRFAGILFAIAGTVFYVSSYLRYFNILSSVFLGTFCYLAALAFFQEKNRFSWKFMIPLCVAISSHLFLMGYRMKLQNDVKNYRGELSQIIGRSVETDDFWHREAQGFPLDREPLKSLIASCPQNSFDDFEYKDAPTAQKKLSEYNKKYPAFVKSLNDFLQLPVSRVAHKKPESEMLYSVLMPELSVFRESARYLAMNLAANSGDKPLVQKYNRDLIRLRNWTLQSDFYISYLVTIAVEAIRLNALSAVLSEGGFSRQEFEKLIGETVDWEKFLKYAYGAEATSFKTGFDYLKMFALLGIYEKKFDSIEKYMPLFMEVYFLRDYRFALQSFIKASTVAPALSGLEKAKLAEVDDREIKRNTYMLSGMFLPSLGSVYIASVKVMNLRRMALLAADVMEYRKQHGKLPEDLSFLSEVPLSKLDHKPLMYEKTEEGFRIFCHTDKGEKPGEEDTRYSYLVQLPEKTELSMEQLTVIAEKELVKVYGERVLKQRPWKITRNDDKSMTLTGTFHGQGKGGVAEITLQKSNGKVLRVIHGK